MGFLGGDREFLADTYTPQFLMGLCKGKTGFQIEKVAAPFLGKWMRVRGTLFKSTPNWAFKNATVTIHLPEESGPYARDAFLIFTRDLDELAMIETDEVVHAEGQIKSIFADQLVLDNCGLVESRMAAVLEVGYRADELKRATEDWGARQAEPEVKQSDPVEADDDEPADFPDVDFEHLKLWWTAFSAAYPQHGEDLALASARATFPKHYVRRQWVRDIRGSQPMGRPRKTKGK